MAAFFDIDDFMLMGGWRRPRRPLLILSKHSYTRRYLNVDTAGDVWKYVEPREYSDEKPGMYRRLKLPRRHWNASICTRCRGWTESASVIFESLTRGSTRARREMKYGRVGTVSMGTHMKTTVEIADPLLEQAKAEARRRGTSLRSLIEEGLRRVIAEPTAAAYVLPDCSVSGGGPTDLWLSSPWDDKLEMIYEGRT